MTSPSGVPSGARPPPPIFNPSYLPPVQGALSNGPLAEGACSQGPFTKDPASPTAWEGCPLGPPLRPPGQAKERTGELPKVTVSSPHPGGALQQPYWQRGLARYCPRAKAPVPAPPPAGRCPPRTPQLRSTSPPDEDAISLPPWQGPRQRPPSRRGLAPQCLPPKPPPPPKPLHGLPPDPLGPPGY